MKYLICKVIFVCAVLSFVASGVHSADRPNIVFIMADDLGWAELGCYGQRVIRTPNIDSLARDGMRFTQFYSGNAVCAPSRCCLMTGLHPGHAYIRDNGNPTGLDDLKAKYDWEFPGQHPIPADTATFTRHFSQAGYTLGAMGKWGLGNVGTTGDPARHGFDLFYGYYCQTHAHNHYPKFLWRNDKKEPQEGNDATLNGQTYSQDRFVEEAVGFIRANREKPFLLYLPFIVPHLSIQAPESAVAPYRSLIKEEDYKHTAYLKHPTPRAAYAGMVTNMDAGVGKILDCLKELQLDGKTIVVFTSDNGPTYDRLGGTDSAYFQSAGALRGLKGSLYEGGIRVPLLVRWPGKIEAGKSTDWAGAHWDFYATLTELAGLASPTQTDGISFAPLLLNKPQKTHEFLYWESPGYGSQQAVRAGSWKAVRQQMRPASRQGRTILTELYDLQQDPNETRNVASENPEIVQRLEAILEQEHTPSTLFPLPGIDQVTAARKLPK